MKYNQDIHHRRSIRSKGYDYSQPGNYYITICTQNRECFFGLAEDEEMALNDVGVMVKKWWLELKNKYKNINLDEFIIMPNHIHGIIEFVGVPLVGTRNVGQPTTTGQPQGIAPTVGDVVGAFKSFSTNEYILNVIRKRWKPFNKRLWQRNYYEHIIRNDDDLNEIRHYIKDNPYKWSEDENNPYNLKK